MQSYQSKSSPETNRQRTILPIVLMGFGACLVGAVVTIGYVSWQAQQQQLAQMAEALDRLKQSQKETAQTDVVTRAVLEDLLSVTAAVQTPVASEDQSSPTPSKNDIETASPLETLAVIHAGVKDMVAAVVAGQYDIRTNHEDEHFSGRIHVTFVGQKKDQLELENYLSSAAKAGIVAHSSSVVDGDGLVNGHILLFDLVERALENGTYEEQRAGQKLRSEALAMLTKAAPVAASATNAAGEQIYTVQPGDSLAYIALQFYGNTNDFVRIFNANRSQLVTTDRIRVGQELLIPNA